VTQRVQGLIIGTLVGSGLGAFIYFGLHAIPIAVLSIGGVVGVSVFAVVSTKTGPEDEAADAAWREAARDLPPVSDRVNLERMQASMPGPLDKRRGGRAAGQKTHPSSGAAGTRADHIKLNPGAEPAAKPVNPNVPSEMERP
jgi:hypothetical protein